MKLIDTMFLAYAIIIIGYYFIDLIIRIFSDKSEDFTKNYTKGGQLRKLFKV